MSGKPYLAYFPKPALYPNQEKAMDAIYKALGDGKLVMFEGACGTGKTLSALTPALSIGKSANKKVVIATSVHQQMAQFVEEAREIRAKAGIKAVTFIGKEKMCPLEKSVFACKSLSMATDALIDAETDLGKLKLLMKSDEWRSMRPDERQDVTREMIATEDVIRKLKPLSCSYLYRTKRSDNEPFRQWLFSEVWSHEDIREKSRTEGKCGYELLKFFMKDADLIICNYHHLIRPEFQERFLTVMGKKLSDLILIFDEAHNLEDQARASGLSPVDEMKIEAAEKELVRLRPDGDQYDERALKAVKEEVRRLLHVLGNTIRQTYTDRLRFGQAENVPPRGLDIKIRDPAGTDDYFCMALKEKIAAEGLSLDTVITQAKTMGVLIFTKAMEDFKNGHSEAFDGSKLLELADFLERYVKLSSDQYHYPMISVHKSPDGRLYGSLELDNCTPGDLSEPLLDGPFGVVLMSATLQPFNTLKEVLKIKRDTIDLAFCSPFSPDRRRNFVVDIGPLIFNNRSDAQLQQTLVRLFEDIIGASAGNVLFFFQTAEEAKKYSRLIKVDVPVLVPEKGTSPEKVKKEFFGHGDAGSKAVMMAYLWGTLTEGVDYKYDRCRTVVVVGVGLQNYKDDRTQAVINAYDSLYPGNGIEYVVSQPAVKKIRQACGRVIRSPTDYGVTILVDSRYTKRFSDGRFGKMGYFYKFPAGESAEFKELKPEEIGKNMRDFFEDIGKQEPCVTKAPEIDVIEDKEPPGFKTAYQRMVESGLKSQPEKKTVRPEPADKPGESDPLLSMIVNLKSTNSSKRWKAAMDLGTTRNPRAVEPLIQALDDPDNKVVLNAIWSLANLGDVRALDPLQMLSRHRDRHVKDEAKKALKKIYSKK